MVQQTAMRVIPVTYGLTSFLRTAQVAKLVQPLHDARGLAAADSVEGFVLGYTSLLEVFPGACHVVILWESKVHRNIVHSAVLQGVADASVLFLGLLQTC